MDYTIILSDILEQLTILTAQVYITMVIGGVLLLVIFTYSILKKFY